MQAVEQFTVAQLIQKYIDDISVIRPFGVTSLYALKRLARDPIGQKIASELKAQDIVEHCRMRRSQGKDPATINQDLSNLRGPLGYAFIEWGLEGISTKPILDAIPLLDKFNLRGKSKPRSRRPTDEELQRLIEYFQKQNAHWRTRIPMDVLTRFAVVSARRVSEICRIRWDDIDYQKRTILVRDMKDPKFKIWNNIEVPLLTEAWDIVMAQPRIEGEPRIFPYNSKSVSGRYTLAKRELGIKNLRFHDNRREAASRLFEKGFGPHEVALVTGHKTLHILYRVYTKLKPEDLHKGPAGLRVDADKQTSSQVQILP